MEYDKEFEEWFEVQDIGWESYRAVSERAWKAARKDHYRIYENVKSLDGKMFAQIFAVVMDLGSNLQILKYDNIRRIHAWTPKEGEAVFLFTGHENRVHIGSFAGFEADGRYKVITQSGECARTNANCIKPFSADKIGKKWKEL